MKEDIISQKIRRELNNLPIDTEPRAMYLMIEIRKVLEHDKIKDSILGFYCDWIAHTKLDRRQAQDIFDRICDENSPEGIHLISFGILRSSLKDFFVKYDLPTDLVGKHWGPFCEAIKDILVDTPIEKTDRGSVIGSFTFLRLGKNIVYRLERGEQGSLGRFIE